MIKRKQITNDDEAILTFEIVQHIPVRLVSVEILKALKLALEFLHSNEFRDIKIIDARIKNQIILDD